MKKQQGVAAIILVLVLIPLFGSVFFALESTRYIQKKTRLADATEAAALAVTDENPEKLTIAETNKESQSLKQLKNEDDLASAYINSYVRNINKDTDNIIITPKIVINKNSDEKSYYQYNVNVTTTHNSWFFSKLIPSFNQTQKINENALARNYPILTGDQPIDLVFVADFSGSMTWPVNLYKYTQTNKCELWNYKIKIFPHDKFNEEKCILDNREIHYTDKPTSENDRHLWWLDKYYHFDYYYKCNNTCYKYKEKKTLIGHDTKINLLKESIETITSEILNNNKTKTQKNRISLTAFDYNTYSKVLFSSNKNTFKPFDYNGFNGYVTQSNYSYNESNINVINNLFNKEPNYTKKSYASFYDLPFTYDKNTFIDALNSIYPENGGTAAYEGIMRGAQLLNNGKKIKDYNKRKKILILLSDGEESQPSVLEGLVNTGLCEKIRTHFSTKNNKMFMGMVGIGYKASDLGVFHQCFDENIYNADHQLISKSNIIDVDDLSTLTDKIKELIRKGQQTDGISKLSDGQN